MLLALSIFALLSLSNAQYRSRCGLNASTTLTETGDGVDGRYTLEWCSVLEEEATEWNFKMDYIDFHNGSKRCPESNSVSASISLSRFLTIHSVFTEKLQRPLPDCDYTCLSKPLDLVFSGCYMVQNQLSRLNGRRTWHRNVTTHLIENRFHSAQDINKLDTVYDIERDGSTLIVTWDLHYIPVLDYSMKITHYDNKNDTEVRTTWKEIHDNCTHDTYSVVCRLPAPQDGRCLAISMQQNALWRRGVLFKDANIMRYCTPFPKPERVETRIDGRIWWAAGALLAALAALAACWAAHSRLLAALRKRVLQHWMQRYSAYAAERDAGSGDADSPRVLLLYARDCAPAMAVVAALKAMLEHAAPGRVYDVFAPECVAAYAASPGAWLRGVVSRQDVRVLLLQTPAAAALYGAQPPEDAQHLEEPLLGSVVQYRRPQYGDALLQYALRLVRDTAHMQHEYTKYYIATISELQCDTLPQVAAYRRYVLPAHATLLLSDLRLRSDASVDALAHAVNKLQDYVRGNENYLRDELMFL